MARILRNLTIDEVSVVDKAANPGARIILHKRDTPRRRRDFYRDIPRYAPQVP